MVPHVQNTACAPQTLRFLRVCRTRATRWCIRDVTTMSQSRARVLFSLSGLPRPPSLPFKKARGVPKTHFRHTHRRHLHILTRYDWADMLGSTEMSDRCLSRMCLMGTHSRAPCHESFPPQRPLESRAPPSGMRAFWLCTF